MRTLSIRYPDSMLAVLNLSAASFEQEARLLLAAKLYEMGRITSGQAAALAGLPRASFLLNCQRHGVASVSWDEDELREEFKDRAP